jgi:hypothetical protein
MTEAKCTAIVNFDPSLAMSGYLNGSEKRLKL